MRATLLGCLVVVACGPRTHVADAGPDDAGVDAGLPDAGRQPGEDPPVGWTYALPVPSDAGAGARWGVSASMALDQFKQPMIAALVVDPNSDGVFDDNRLVFTRWNGVSKTWQDPVTIEVVGDIVVDHPSRQVSLARNATSGQLGVVYPNANGVIRRAWSDDEGAHWSQEVVSGATTEGTLKSNPVLGMRADELDVAYVSNGQVILRTRMGTGSFTDVSIGTVVPDWPISMALPPTGPAQLAYFSADDAGTTLTYVNGSSAPVTLDSSTAPVDTAAKLPSVTLDLEGDVPKVAYHLISDTSADGELWYATASDSAGTTWSAPVALPRNGPVGMLDGTQWYQAVTLDGAGKTAVVGNFQHRTAVTSQECGGPKLGRSSDGMTWTVCHPTEVGGPTVHTFDFAGWWLTMASHKTGKLTIAMDYETRTNPTLLGGGVAVYREP